MHFFTIDKPILFFCCSTAKNTLHKKSIWQCTVVRVAKWFFVFFFCASFIISCATIKLKMTHQHAHVATLNLCFFSRLVSLSALGLFFCTLFANMNTTLMILAFANFSRSVTTNYCVVSLVIFPCLYVDIPTSMKKPNGKKFLTINRCSTCLPLPFGYKHALCYEPLLECKHASTFT